MYRSLNIKSLSLAVSALVLSTNVNASLVSIDLNASGDGLITRDTLSGLDWLDLTATDNMSFNDTVSQLSSGGQFDGFRYATSAEVIALWDNFNIDLRQSAPASSSGYNPVLYVPVTLLGSTHNTDLSLYPYGGTLGLTSDVHSNNRHDVLGAYYASSVDTTRYKTDNITSNSSDDIASNNVGSYLVRESISSVPIPAAVWLFGSGLIGLIGVARRKKA